MRLREDYNTLRGAINENGENRMQAYALWIEQQFDIDQTRMLPLVAATPGRVWRRVATPYCVKMHFGLWQSMEMINYASD